MAIGEPERPVITILDWHDLYLNVNEDESIIDGLAFRGRWTTIAAGAKAGKSTVLLGLVVDAARRGVVVVYIDAEMGRVDVLERIGDWMQLKPDDLTNIHYTDLPPKVDTVQGATALYNTVVELQPDLVVFDGLNGMVNGAENDDTTWRDLYEWAIAPLKKMNIAVISLDNAGHGERKGPRGSSVKLDKADAVIVLQRTDIGSKLTTTHRRSASYPLEQEYTVTDADETGPPMQVKRVGAGTGAPAGTKRIVALLDDLSAPIDISRRRARELLKDNGHDAPRNAELGAMLKWRRDQTNPFQIAGPLVPLVPGTTRDHHLKVVPNSGDHSDKTPASGVVPDWVLSSGTHLAEPEKDRGPLGPEAEYEDPFA